MWLNADDTIVVEWDPPYDGGSPIRRYEVTVRANNDPNHMTVVETDNWMLLTGMEPNTVYRISVFAANAVGEGGHSPDGVIRTPGVSTPELPIVDDMTASLGDPVDLTLPEAVGGDAPLTYLATGLPEGMTFDRNGRRITGKPTTQQSIRVTYYVTDADGDSDRLSFTWTVHTGAQETSTNRAPVVSMVHESLTIQGGLPLLLNAKAHDPDGDQLTYEWTVVPMVGNLVQAFPSNPSWFSPEGTSTAQVVTVTLTARDGHGGLSSADMEITVLPATDDMPTPPDDLVGRLHFAVERMLASPSQYDASTTVEERNPWLRQAWDFATKSGSYADLDYEFEIEFGGEIPFVPLECHPVEPGEYLGRCAPSRLVLPESFLDDEYIVGDLWHILWSTMAHELAHVFTMSSLVSADGGQAPRPDLYAISMLALFKQHSEPGNYWCDGRELLADTLQVMAFPATWGSYWFDCKGLHHPSEEDGAHAIAQSLLDGQYPDWFVEEYGLPNGGFALRRLWTDVIALEQLDPFPKQLLVWQLRNAFGTGYCSYEMTADSTYRGAYLPNPWATGYTDEAGCG